MTSNLRVVLDTNVVVSAALLRRSTPRQAVDQVLAQGTLLGSPATLTELNEVIARQRFNRYLSEEERLEFVGELVRVSELVEVTAEIAVCRDPKDDKLLELAVSGAATHIITGDEDLLSMHPFRGIAILSPHQFVIERDTLM